MKKTTLHKMFLQSRNNWMILTQMTLETQRIYLDSCSSMRNVGILSSQLMVESLLEILTKRRIQTFYKPIDVYFVTNVIGESISSIRMWNIVNQLGKHNFSCGQILFRQVVSNLRGRKLFSNQMNRNRFDLILASPDRSCCTMNKLRCPNSAVNETF